MAIYDIDLLRALFVDKLNDNTIFLASFYEQIQDDEQINRYVDTIKELLALQNREKSESNYKAMGIIAQSGNAEIINIKQNYISPLEYQARFDIELSDRDYVLGKLKILINELRGRKFDVIALVNGQIKVIAEPLLNVSARRMIITSQRPNNFVTISNTNPTAITPTNFLTHLTTTYSFPLTNFTASLWFIYENNLYSRNIISTVVSGVQTFTFGTSTNLGVVEGQYKLSLSFDGIQSQEPYINNGVDRVFLFFGGSATIVESKVSLGNDIITTTIQVGKDSGTTYIVEPTEIPASVSVSDDTFQTYTTGYQSVDRNMAIGNKMSYSFIYDTTNALYNDLYQYARFGKKSDVYTQIVLTIREYRLSFGQVLFDTFYAKLGDVSTSNTNGDVMTINATLKVGAYNLVGDSLFNWTYQGTTGIFNETTNFTYPSTTIYLNTSAVPVGQLASYLQTSFPVGDYVENTIFRIVVSASIKTNDSGWEFVEITSSPATDINFLEGSLEGADGEDVSLLLEAIEQAFPASENQGQYAQYFSTSENLLYIFYSPISSTVQFVRNEFYKAVLST
jgi:hypothetical protein